MEEENSENKVVEVSINTLDQRLIKQLSDAEKSLDKNPEYAVNICMTILNKYPSCADVRKILREAQARKYGKGNPIAKVVAGIKGLLLMIQSGSKIKKGNALEVITAAEKLLVECFDNPFALTALAKAAESLEYFSTSANAYQAIATLQPNNIKNLLALGEAYVKNKQPDEAISVGNLILRKNPSNGDAEALLRSASVVKTMDKGNWEDQDMDFKSKLKDADEAISLEKSASTINDEETMLKMVEELKVKIAADPENVNLYREICAHLRNLKDFKTALEYVKQARQQPLGQADTTLEKLEYDFILSDMASNIQKLEEQLSANPDNADLAKNIEELKIQERKYKVDNARDMVERYPNDYNYRFNYGQLMFEDGKLDEAIMQFQLSQRNPKVRLASLLGLGRAFLMGKKYDLAIDQLATAKKESKLMNDSKKEIIYELASAYEAMGKSDKAFEEYKEIYSSDISYKDVSKKINDYYESKNS